MPLNSHPITKILISLTFTVTCASCLGLIPRTREGFPGQNSASPTGIGAGLRTLPVATPTPWGWPYTNATPSPSSSPSPTPQTTPKDQQRTTTPRPTQTPGPEAPSSHHLSLELNGVAYSADFLGGSGAIPDFGASAQGFGVAVGDSIGNAHHALLLGYRYEQMALPVHPITLSDGPLTLKTHELFVEGRLNRISLGFSLGFSLPEHTVSPAVTAQCPGCSEDIGWGLGSRVWMGYGYPLGEHIRLKLTVGDATYYHWAEFKMPGKAQHGDVNFQWMFVRPGVEIVF